MKHFCTSSGAEYNKPTIKELMGIVYERVVAIQLNIVARVCSACYMIGGWIYVVTERIHIKICQ